MNEPASPPSAPPRSAYWREREGGGGWGGKAGSSLGAWRGRDAPRRREERQARGARVGAEDGRTVHVGKAGEARPRRGRGECVDALVQTQPARDEALPARGVDHPAR